MDVLPGLGPESNSSWEPPVVRSVRITLDHLEALGLRTPATEAQFGIVLDLARDLAPAKAYAAASVVEQLHKALDRLPQPAVGDAWDDLAATMGDLMVPADQDALVAPRYATTPTPGAAHQAHQVGAVARMLGTPLMPWQAQVSRVATELRPGGRWRYPVIVITVPRQSGKTTLMRSVLVQRAIVRTKLQAFYTAQTGKDARKRWLDIVEAVETNPKFAPYTEVKKGAGDSSISFVRNGSQVSPFAPTPNSLHGYTPPLVMLDESFAHSQDLGTALMGAITPAQSTLADKQLWIVSTAGSAESVWLKSWVDRGRDAVSDPDATMAYFEWSAPPDADPYDPEVWASFHPAVGHTLSVDGLRDDAAVTPPGEWLRAYCNLWTRSSETIFPLPDWDSLALTALPPPHDGVVGVGIDVSADLDHGSIWTAWVADETVYARPVRTDAGIGWLAGAARAALDAIPGAVLIATDAGSIRQVTDELALTDTPITLVKERDYATSCARLLWLAKHGRLRHDASPTLRAALADADTRPMGETWGISRNHSRGPVDALTALVVAARAAEQVPEEDQPEAYFG